MQAQQLIVNYQETPASFPFLPLNICLDLGFISSVCRYLSEEDVVDQVNPFVQLISGVVWLLRAGEIYIDESIQAECDKTQETGKISTHYIVFVL